MPILTHMLVPLDGSRLAEVVIPTALGLSAGLGARVTLLHVLERGAPSTRHGEKHLTDTNDAHQYLAALAARYARPGLQISYHVHDSPENDVAASIVAHAKELSADMIALTPHGRSDLRRWLIGSIPQIVLQRGGTPVLFVPPAPDNSESTFELRNLLVPVQGHAAEEVLTVAHALCLAFNAQASIVRVVPTLGTVQGVGGASARFSPVSTAATLDLEEGAAQAYLQQQVLGWPDSQQPVISVLRGEPVKVIIELINRSNTDLTLMSTHGRSGLAGVWSASVTSRVLGRSQHPLLLMRVSE